MPRISAVERRALLCEAALLVLSRDGLGALTTRAVVAEAGMSLASFHYAYDSREQLLGDVIAAVIAKEREAGLAGLLAEAGSAEQALRAAVRGYLALLRADPGREQGMLELTQAALRTEALSPLAAAQYRHYHDVAADLLAQVATRHDVVWRAPLADLAALVVALTDGMTLAWLAERDDAALDRLADLAVAALVGQLEPALATEAAR
ncbi:hypothetical protein GCM10011519_09060 [Marmoricola endophyticus]|uniref:HTH tetR-type domain-containing protein n=2 Tax=Marmoricola endophyticus TaxID=2040280 RepID=A0A917F112_9ACTN|nr:hypothetical protein GCM10011519_09060 [Marmoricola endophyticus]